MGGRAGGWTGGRTGGTIKGYSVQGGCDGGGGASVLRSRKGLRSMATVCKGCPMTVAAQRAALAQGVAVKGQTHHVKQSYNSKWCTAQL